ncbi:AAA family ATPase, partial [Salmonella enterica]|nr:AAA family ATPase [Salmonella enterica]
KKELGQSTKGFKRERNKTLFNDNINFFRMVLRNWLEREENHKANETFYKGLRILFQKVCAQNGIDRNTWNFEFKDLLI